MWCWICSAWYIQAQLNLAYAIREATDAGQQVPPLWRTWLDQPPERAVIEARIEGEHVEHDAHRLNAAVDEVLDALEQHGHAGTFDPDDIEHDA